MKKEHFVTLIVCTKNEESTIKNVLRSSKPFVDEILVIDGHSSDNTVKIIKEEGIRVELDQGKSKGNAIKLGIEKAKGDILVLMDADGSHEPKDMPKLIKPILENKADLVVASRFLGGSDELHGKLEHFIRMLGGSILSLIVNYFLEQQLTDLINGFRAIKKDVAQKLNLKTDKFDIELEMVIKAIKKGYKVVEVPSHEYKRQGGESKLSNSRGWIFIWCLIKEMLKRNDK